MSAEKVTAGQVEKLCEELESLLRSGGKTEAVVKTLEALGRAAVSESSELATRKLALSERGLLNPDLVRKSSERGV